MSAQVSEDSEVSEIDEPTVFAPEPDDSVVERDVPEAPRGGLRADFGAHFEAHYPRLVGQLFAITLDSGAAHDLVQDAYSRAWRRWSEVREGDAEAWVRRVAVRASRNPLRRLAAKLGLRTGRVPEQEGLDPRTASVLAALAELPLEERRAAVLVYMAGMTTGEVAVLEGVSVGTVQARLNRVGTRIEHAVAGLAFVAPAGAADHEDTAGETPAEEEDR
ncbi:RNA polymerase sigma factor [Pseudonocardia xishanensis]|uniref:RNA polymerase sigma-70 factor (ECF subfamily) n=1 Tax=Pseudonocardia xishanensis TaxID=630995 RepID=A0ABP8RZZ6_9PSEU